MNCEKELPRYKCHKEVWALKIEEIVINPDGSANITPCDPRYDIFTVEKEYIDKHKPKVGGYYVVYADGYKSWSPADVFEDGYVCVYNPYIP